MLTFAVKKKGTSSIVPKRHAPSVSPMSHSLHLQQEKVRHILRGPTLQPKLTIGQPNDKYEQEADRVAEQVMRMPEPRLQRQVEPEEEEEETLQTKPLVSQITPLVQVQRQEEPEEEEEEPIQTKQVSTPAPAVTPNLASRIQSLKGGGQPLSESTRAFFEPRFGHDFSQVRLHTDTKAAESARAVNARAYTVGRDIVFGTGQFSPGTTSGQRLLSHELTHVVQQLTQPKLFTMTNPISVQRCIMFLPQKYKEYFKLYREYKKKQQQLMKYRHLRSLWEKYNTEAENLVESTKNIANKARKLMRYLKITEALGAVHDAVRAAEKSIIFFAHSPLTLGGKLIQNKRPPYKRPPLSMTLSTISMPWGLYCFSRDLESAAHSYNNGFFYVVAACSFRIVSDILQVIHFISRTRKSFKYYSRKDIKREGLYSPNMKASVVDVKTGKAYNVKCVSGPSYWHIDAVPLTEADTKILANIYGIYTKTKINNRIESYFAYSCPTKIDQYSSVKENERRRKCKEKCRDLKLWHRRAVFFIISDKRGKQIIIPASQHGAPHGSGILREVYRRCQPLRVREPNKYPGHFCIHFRDTKKKQRKHKAMVAKAARKLGLTK